jgi:hypothetical protein
MSVSPPWLRGWEQILDLLLIGVQVETEKVEETMLPFDTRGREKFWVIWILFMVSLSIIQLKSAADRTY